jgi:hypothetical protein
MSNTISRHAFTSTIATILERHYGEYAGDVFAQSPILGYLNHKTKSASRGSKKLSENRSDTHVGTWFPLQRPMR